MKTSSSTMNYYNMYATEFIENTFSVTVSETLENFARLLPKNAHVLDVGCGSGRDSLAFLQKGFTLTAFDASPEIAHLASQKINHPILVETIENMKWENEFDAVWAMASLLHLNKDELHQAISNCVKSLKTEENGLFYSAFKMGYGEGYDEKGRFFSYYQPEELKNILDETGHFNKIDYTITEDALGRANTSWISFIAEKKPNLIFNNNVHNYKVKI